MSHIASRELAMLEWRWRLRIRYHIDAYCTISAGDFVACCTASNRCMYVMEIEKLALARDARHVRLQHPLCHVVLPMANARGELR